MIRQAAIAVAAVLATLLACELALRPQIASIDETVEVFGPPTADGRCYALRPNATAIYQGWLWRVAPSAIQIDARGYRERVRTAKPAPSVRRIAVVGDSMVFGLGVNLHEALPAQLEQRLAGDGAVEVINAGVPGYDAASMVARAGEVVRDFAPTELVVVVDGNDFDRLPCERWRSRTSPWLRRSALLRLASIALGGDPLHGAVVRDARSQAAVLDGLAALGVPTRLAVLSGQDASLLEQARSRTIEVVDLSEAHRAILADPQRYVLIGEGHPNREGIALLAERLADGTDRRKRREPDPAPSSPR